MKKEPCEQTKMLKQIMSLHFSVIDLNLFLDTHPNDMQAINEFNRKNYEFKMLWHAYEQKYGPLNAASTIVSGCPWRWIEEPWPWQVEF